MSVIVVKEHQQQSQSSTVCHSVTSYMRKFHEIGAELWCRGQRIEQKKEKNITNYSNEKTKHWTYGLSTINDETWPYCDWNEGTDDNICYKETKPVASYVFLFFSSHWHSHMMRHSITGARIVVNLIKISLHYTYPWHAVRLEQDTNTQKVVDKTKYYK